MINRIKTFSLLAILSVIFIIVGKLLAGNTGMTIFFILSLGINFFSYYFSDKIVLTLYRAKPLSYNEFPEVHHVVKEVAQKAGIKKPEVYVAPVHQPNAFATGRNPENGVIVLTYGILKLLNLRELQGVIAHEISHIKNRDTLIQTISATIVGALTYIANVFRWIAIFGIEGEDDRGNAIYLFVLSIIAPIAALLIHFAISRSREYLADEIGAKTTRDPLALASALEKLDFSTKRMPVNVNPANSHMFIVNPAYRSSFITALFSTHPPVEERIRRLKKLSHVI